MTLKDVKTDADLQRLRLDPLIRGHCEATLALCGGSIRRAAAALGIGHNTLYRWIAKWNAEDEMVAESQEMEERAHGR